MDLRGIVEKAFERLGATLGGHLPHLLACAAILMFFWLLATLLRWVVLRIFKGAGVDRFLHQTGVYAMLDQSGRLRASRLVASTVYWTTIGIGLLTGLSAFDTEMTTRMINAVVFLMPKLVTALAIVLVGAWLGQYLGRSMLIWASNEGLPGPRNLSAGRTHPDRIRRRCRRRRASRFRPQRVPRRVHYRRGRNGRRLQHRGRNVDARCAAAKNVARGFTGGGW